MDYLFTAMALLFSTILGFMVLRLMDADKKLNFLESLALSYGIGIGLISVEMTILALARLDFTAQNILIPLAAIIVPLYFIFNRGRFRIQFKHERFRPLELFFLGGIAFEVCYSFFRCLIKPIESYDAVAHWGLKAKAIYFFKGLPLDIFTRPCPFDLVFTADYPWLVPFSQSYVHIFLGHFNDFASKALTPLFFLACMVVFYSLLKRLQLGRLHRLIFTFLLASIPQFNAYAAIGYADLIIGFYYSVSFICLYLWFRGHERVFLLISALFTAMAGYTKCEGMLLGVINMLVFLSFMLFDKLSDKKKLLKDFLVYIFIVVILLLPVFILRHLTSAGLPNHTLNLSALSDFKLTNFKRIPLIIYSYQKQFFGIKRWNIVWVLFLGVIFFRFKRLFSGDMKYITTALALIFLAHTTVFIMSPVVVEDLRTVSRLLLHFFPVVIFFLARYFAYQLQERRDRI